MSDNALRKIYVKNPQEYSERYIQYLCQVLTGIDHQQVSNFIKLLIRARENQSTIFFIGNGGSAATASHFANDISIGTRTLNKPFRALSLCDNSAVITAIANDDGYDDIFIQQLRSLSRPGDILVAISTSGNSSNIIKTVNYANENSIETLGITAFEGGELRKISKHNIHVATGIGEYGPAEDAHMVLDHLVGSYLINYLRENDPEK